MAYGPRYPFEAHPKRWHTFCSRIGLVCVVFCTTALESVSRHHNREMMRKRESVDAQLPEKGKKGKRDLMWCVYDHGLRICVDNIPYTYADTLIYIIR